MRHLKLVSRQTRTKPQASLKIAFASSDRKTVNQHLGAAQAFVIYELGARGFHLVEVVEFSGESIEKDGQEDKLTAKIALLEGCAAVHCNAVGASAIRQLLAANIQPLKVDANEDIETLLKELQAVWEDQPPVWLERSLRQLERSNAEERFAAMASEGWQEEEWQS